MIHSQTFHLLFRPYLLCLDIGWNLNISISDQLKVVMYLVDLSRTRERHMMVFV